MADKAKGRRTYGLYRRNFPKPVRWAVDQDYAEKLNEQERAYLARFNDFWYGADFREDSDGKWSVEERRKVYRQKNGANNDAYEIAAVSGLVVYADNDENGTGARMKRVASPSDRDESVTPSYLRSGEYKSALDEFRRTMPKRVGEVSREHDAARVRLEEVVNGSSEEK